MSRTRLHLIFILRHRHIVISLYIYIDILYILKTKLQILHYWLWFQTFFILHIWDVILPIDEVIVFKMVKTTNQWIGLRENLNRKPSNFPLNIRGFRFQFSRKNQSIKPIRLTVAIYPWIGLRENLQESPMIFMWKIYGFL
jgi:hypothetical protein